MGGEVVGQPVVRERLDGHHRALLGELIPGPCGGRDWVPEVMQPVEEPNRVVRPAVEARRVGDLKPHPIRYTSCGGAPARLLDRGLVQVDTDKPGVEVGLGHQHGRDTLAAADAGDAAPWRSTSSRPSAGIQSPTRLLR